MALLRSLGGWCVVVWLGAVPCVAAARARETPDEEPAAESGWEHRFGLEVRAQYRRSDDNRFKTPFTINNVPVFEETVDPGAHYEFSDVTQFADVSRGDLFTVPLWVVGAVYLTRVMRNRRREQAQTYA
jgi:hypothetical protein